MSVIRNIYHGRTIESEYPGDGSPERHSVAGGGGTHATLAAAIREAKAMRPVNPAGSPTATEERPAPAEAATAIDAWANDGGPEPEDGISIDDVIPFPPPRNPAA